MPIYPLLIIEIYDELGPIDKDEILTFGSIEVGHLTLKPNYKSNPMGSLAP